MLKRCLLRLHLKLARVFVNLTDSGRLSETIGPATKMAQSPNLVCVRGTMKSRLVVEWRRCCAGSLLADVMHSLRYTSKWVPASAGKAKAGMVHSVSGWTRGVHVKLWDPLRTLSIPESLRGVFTARRYTNPRLPYLTTCWLTGSDCISLSLLHVYSTNLIS